MFTKEEVSMALYEMQLYLQRLVDQMKKRAEET